MYWEAKGYIICGEEVSNRYEERTHINQYNKFPKKMAPNYLIVDDIKVSKSEMIRIKFCVHYTNYVAKNILYTGLIE